MLKPELPDMSGVPHHPAVETIAPFLSLKSNNEDIGFFRLVAAHFLGLPASALHARVRYKKDEIPINNYMLALAESGAGKGRSTGLMREMFLKNFRTAFREDVLPLLAEQNLCREASRRAVKNSTAEEQELEKLRKEYESKGAYHFTFSEGSAPAAKQIREKIILAQAGSLNLQIDELGKNLEGSNEILTTFLELYDKGFVGSKIKVSSAENRRGEEMEGFSPANLFAFGEPTAVFDGSTVEKAFYSFLQAGYARRFIFAYGRLLPIGEDLTDEELYDMEDRVTTDPSIQQWVDHITSLADINFHQWTIDVPREVGIEVVRYRRQCERVAKTLSSYDVVHKTELRHRYFKTLKLAGAYAFLDQSSTLTKDHFFMAMKLVEESGQAFQDLLTQEKPHMKLARYIAEKGTELTNADLSADLTFYPKASSPRKDMMGDAVAWGYRNNIIIRKTYGDGIEFFTGETIHETDIDDMIFSYSDHQAHGYAVEEAKIPFNKLEILATAPDIHWCNHAFDQGHRAEVNAIPGFNLVVLDFDGGVPLNIAHDMLADYRFMTYTTKRHVPTNPDEHRFRLILPTNYVLKLDAEDYREFMNQLMDWLPFPNSCMDSGSNQRSKKWLSNPGGSVYFSDGKELIDVLPFIPKTHRNEEYHETSKDLKSLDSLERWFAERMAHGNRNNHMIRFALALVDGGLTFSAVEERVLSFNAKLQNGLSEDELKNTVLKTAAQRVALRAGSTP